ncbi:MAG TPA: NUDIX hydrolase [Roseiflexaceae bacterium]|nr:NUDIX hydrolase [Roseiflexaceae bacterium]HMP43215.1 NUDIX hydrolase [Roseiflexaceae bacterium]
MSDRLMRWAQRLQAMAQTGLEFSNDQYDIARYHELRTIAAEMAAGTLADDPAYFDRQYAREAGYATPKIDVRGAAFRDDGILLVRERSDGLWTLPGGWADVGDTPAAAVEREIFEESGYTARAIRVAAVYDRDRQGHAPIPYAVYKIFFICELTGGAAATDHETDDVGFFGEHALPPLSLSRTLPAQIGRMFGHYRNPHWATDFD